MLKDVRLNSKREASDLLFNINKLKLAGAALKSVADYLYYQIIVSVICALLTFAWIWFALIGLVISIFLVFYVINSIKEAGDALSNSIEIKEEAKI